MYFRNNPSQRYLNIYYVIDKLLTITTLMTFTFNRVRDGQYLTREVGFKDKTSGLGVALP